MAPQEGSLRPGAGWKDLERGVERSHGERGFTTTAKDPAVYVKNSWRDQDYTAAGLWVDDCVAIGSGEELASLAKSVDAKYGTTGLGEVQWVLGMLMERDRPARTISISQEAFVDSIPA